MRGVRTPDERDSPPQISDNCHELQHVHLYTLYRSQKAQDSKIFLGGMRPDSPTNFGLQPQSHARHDSQHLLPQNSKSWIEPCLQTSSHSCLWVEVHGASGHPCPYSMQVASYRMVCFSSNCASGTPPHHRLCWCCHVEGSAWLDPLSGNKLWHGQCRRLTAFSLFHHPATRLH